MIVSGQAGRTGQGVIEYRGFLIDRAIQVGRFRAVDDDYIYVWAHDDHLYLLGHDLHILGEQLAEQLPIFRGGYALGRCAQDRHARLHQSVGQVERGLAAERVSRDLLAGWLANQPDPRLLDLWKSEVQRVWNRFTTDEQLQMRHKLLGAAREVAEAAGSVLGLTSGISAREDAVLQELERVVT